jgi:hypothetical protein
MESKLGRLVVGGLVVIGALACEHPTHPRPAEVPIETSTPVAPAPTPPPAPGSPPEPEAPAEPTPEPTPPADEDAPPPEPAALRAARAELARTDEPPCAIRSSVVSVAHTACFGTCPIYSVAVRSDGLVQYFGEQYVDTLGYASWTIDPGAARRLACQVSRHRFDGLPREFRPCATDAPLTVTRAMIDGQVHVVSRSSANEMCRGPAVAPRWLVAMEARIDEVAGTAARIRRREDGGSPARPTPLARSVAPAAPRGTVDARAVWRDELAALETRCRPARKTVADLTIATYAYEAHATLLQFTPSDRAVVRCVSSAVDKWGSPLYAMGEVDLHLELEP